MRVIHCFALALLVAARAGAAEPRVDRFGDPLPDGAVMRLGTVGFRMPVVAGVGIRANGELVALSEYLRLHVWPADGKTKPNIFPLTEKPEHGWRRALSADGRFVAAQRFRQVAVWDVSTNKPVEHTSHLMDDVYAMAFSRDGHWLAVNDTTRGTEGVWLCDVAAKKWERLALDKMRYVESLSFSPDGKWLTVLSDQNINVVDTATQKVHFRWKVQGMGRAACATVSPDGATLFIQPTTFLGGRQDQPQAIAIPSGQPAAAKVPPPGYSRWAGFTPDGKHLLLGNPRGIREWDPVKGTLVREIAGPAEHPAVYSPDGRRLAACGGAAVLYWDLDKGRPVRPDLADAGHTNSIYGITVSPDGKLIATSGIDDDARLWSAADGRLLCRIRSQWGRMVFLPDSRLVVVGEDYVTPVMYDATTAKELRRFTVPEAVAKAEHVHALELAAEGKEVVTIMHPNTVGPKASRIRWNIQKGVMIERTEATENWVMEEYNPSATSPDGRWRVSGGSAFCAATKESFAIVPPREVYFAATPAQFTPDSRFVALARTPQINGRSDYENGRVAAFDLKTGVRVGEVASGRTYRWAFSPDGRLLATTGDAHVVVWDLASGKEVRRFAGLVRAMAVAFSRDGRRLITGHDDSVALVWDVAPTGPAPAALTADELTRHWEALTGADTARAYAAEWELADRSVQAVALLRERLKPARAVEEEPVRKHVARLSSTNFTEREAATKSLRELGDAAVPHLRAALKAGLPAEAKTRIERLLAEADTSAVPAGERQRQVRAIAVLARINNDDARKLLTELAAGSPEARQTREASEALKREK